MTSYRVTVIYLTKYIRSNLIFISCIVSKIDQSVPTYAYNRIKSYTWTVVRMYCCALESLKIINLSPKNEKFRNAQIYVWLWNLLCSYVGMFWMIRFFVLRQRGSWRWKWYFAPKAGNKSTIQSRAAWRENSRWRSCLRQCATSRKVAGSIPDGVIRIFHWRNPSGHTMALGSTQPLTEMSTRNISWG